MTNPLVINVGDLFLKGDMYKQRRKMEQDKCPHQNHCVLISVYQKPYCTEHYSKQCNARRTYDHKIALKKLDDVKDELLGEEDAI